MTAPVRVVDQVLERNSSSGLQSAVQGFYRTGGIKCRMDFPPHDPSRVSVRHQGKVNEPFPRYQVSDVANPYLVRTFHAVTFHQVRVLVAPSARIGSDDTVTKIGGLAHIMLPDSTTIRNSSQNIAKFADTGIDELVRQMEKLGAKKARMVAKIAGGATMFTFQGKNDMMQVGDRNVEAVKKKLKEISIPILAQDTGKNYGRTVTFYPETGEFHIRAVGKSESII